MSEQGITLKQCLHGRNEGVFMNEIVAESSLVAKCGLYCGACKMYLNKKCPGCSKNEKASWCKVRTCCSDKRHGSCADCKDYNDPSTCNKFNNFISKIFGLVFNSDRKACIAQIKKVGISGHAQKMALEKKQSIKAR
jgi:hypothetical protein